MKRFPICACIVVILIVWISPYHRVSAGGEPGFEAIDAYIQQRMQNAHIPGVSLAITQKDQIVHLGGFGVADPSGRPMTAQIPMLIGSLSKSFTALGVMQLVEAGRIDLDAPVQRYLTWFRVGPPLNIADSEDVSTLITPRHLLNQVSGFSRPSGEKNDD